MEVTGDSLASIDKVCEFLHQRCVSESVIANLKSEKMDMEAISCASEKELLLLGLEKKGDVLSLKRFCEKTIKEIQNEQRQDEKRSLLKAILEKGKSSRKKSATASNSKSAVVTGKGKSGRLVRKVQIGWLHYNEEKNSFVSVRSRKGGGCRDIELPLSANKAQIISTAKGIFFNDDGMSTFGPQTQMMFGLANFKQEDLTTIKESGVELPFTLQRYMDKFKMARVRLYLTSRLISTAKENYKEEMQPASESGDESDSSLLKPTFDKTDSQSELLNRRILISEQNKAYEESLAADQAKDIKKINQESQAKELKEKKDEEYKKKLHQARKTRVSVEPPEGEDVIIVQVQHLSLGIVKRRFLKTKPMANVYDWVGSLSLTPVHFELSDFRGKIFQAYQDIEEASNMTLYMKSANATPHRLESDMEVDFIGFGCPHQLMEEDESSDEISTYSESGQMKRKIMQMKEDPLKKMDKGYLFRQYHLPLILNKQNHQNGRQQKDTAYSETHTCTSTNDYDEQSGDVDQLFTDNQCGKQPDLVLGYQYFEESNLLQAHNQDNQDAATGDRRGDAAGEGRGDAAGDRRGDAAGEGRGDAAGDRRGDAAGEGRGDAAGDRRGDAAGEGIGDAAGEGRGDAAGEGRGDAAGDRRGDAAGEGRGDAAGDRRGDAAGEGRGDAAGEGRGDATGDGRGNTAGDGGSDPPSHGSCNPSSVQGSRFNKRFLRIKRVSILKDMVDAFKDATIMDAEISVSVVNEYGKEELGVDDGGVLRDALSAFWKEFFLSCTMGEDQQVPYLRHDYKFAEWQSVGRILVKGFQQIQYFPHRLCKAVVSVALHGEKAVSKSMLLECFKSYVSFDERELINAALMGEIQIGDDRFDEWAEFLDRFSCKKIPKACKDVEEVLVEVAHKELVQTAKYVIDCWIKPFQVLKNYQEFSTVAKLEELYEKKKPTTRKVLNLFSGCQPITNAQHAAFTYLQRFIRGLTQEKLEGFLRFVTGASVLCVEKVDVMFTNLDGAAARRPIAHTCAPMLELPSTYDSFPQFREELNNILASGFWGIDFV